MRRNARCGIVERSFPRQTQALVAESGADDESVVDNAVEWRPYLGDQRNFLPGAALCQRRPVPLPQSLDQRLGRNDHHVDLNAARFPASSALMRQVDAGLFCGCNRGTAFWGWVSAYGLGEGSVGWSDRRRPWHGRISGALTPGPISLR